MFKSDDIPTSKQVVGCGVRVFPPQILIKYVEGQKRKLHAINVKALAQHQNLIPYVDHLYEKHHHRPFLDQLPRSQTVRLISILRDLENGTSLEQSLKYNDAMDRISPNEDLNKQPDEVVQR